MGRKCGTTRAGSSAGRSGPDLALERAGLARISRTSTDQWLVAGVDEAGRGPWAGPVVAAAVILDPRDVPAGIDDSKALNAEDRARLYDEILARAQVGVGMADVARIDRDNILQATLWAMREAVDRLPQKPSLALVDGNRAPELDCAIETVVGGDARSLSIAAASIVAKVTRDRLMDELAGRYPGYGWDSNKGYGTPSHRAGLARLGVTPEHRRSFRPVRLILEGGSLSAGAGPAPAGTSAESPRLHAKAKAPSS